MNDGVAHQLGRARNLLREPSLLFGHPKWINGPASLRFRVKRLLTPAHNLNIGSGQRRWPGWICLDEFHDLGTISIVFDERSKFPVASNSMSLAYSSHFLEHIADEVVDQILRETFRCLQVGDGLLLKIPDFDMFLNAFCEGRHEVLDYIGSESVAWTWATHQVEDTPANRLSMMFCGYMNEQYGTHFIEIQGPRSSGSYHGPVPMNQDELNDLLLHATSAHALAKQLRERSLVLGEVFRFNHQNAWGRAELFALLREHGFEVEELDDLALAGFATRIPDLDQYRSWSIYVFARKPKP
ncbi:MAG: hypothetical protein Q7L55_10140 [Actinomycetota bacterium]|nr:hypothetical protein [Actinomycetota bacterium]